MDANTQPLVFAVLTFLSAAKSGRVVHKDNYCVAGRINTGIGQSNEIPP